MGEIKDFYNSDDLLSIALVNFQDATNMTVDDLFDGFDDLKVVTYSYDLNFIEEISKKFKTMTVLLGSEKITKGDIWALILASQRYSIENIRRHKVLYNRAIEGNIIFKLAKDVESHQKIYLLSRNDGQTRVIIGSANFSHRAFAGYGIQWEVFADLENDDRGYQHFLSIFNTLESFCMNTVEIETLNAIRSKEIEIDDIPFSKEVMREGIAEIFEESSSDNIEKIESIVDITKHTKEYSDLIKKSKVRPKSEDGKKLITSDYILKLKKENQKNIIAKQKVMEIYPKFHWEYETGLITYNDKFFNYTNIDDSKVKEDLLLLEEYFKGFDNFDGGVENIKSSKHSYYQIMNFMFLAPFIGKLRYEAYKNDRGLWFPYFIVLSGRAAAGKTDFIKFIQHVMTEDRMKDEEQQIWTKSKIKTSLLNAEGLPILIDEVDKKQFNDNVRNIICCDNWLVEERILNHGIYVLASNTIKFVNREFSRRLYYAPISISIGNSRTLENEHKVKNIVNNFSIDFYKKYLIKMLPLVDDVIKYMNSDGPSVSDKLDIFAMSSKVIRSLYEEYNLKIPDFMDVLCYSDYFDESSEDIRQTKLYICNAWLHNSEAFKIDKNSNSLEFQPGEQSYKADNLLKKLPNKLNADVYGTKIVMDLDKAQEFFGIKFQKKGLFNR